MIAINVDKKNAELLLNSLRNYSISYQTNIDYFRQRMLLEPMLDSMRASLESSERRVNDISLLIAAIEIAVKGGLA